MKRGIFYLIVSVLISLSVSVCAEPTWNVVGYEGIPINCVSAHNFKMVLDNNNTPYIAFQEYVLTTQNTSIWNISVMKYCNGEWNYVGTPNIVPDVTKGINYFSFTISANGEPYVAFSGTSAEDQGKVSVMRFNGNNWVYVGSQLFSPGIAYSLSLKFSPSGTLFIAYYDGSVGGKLSVMKYNGVSWEQVGNAGFGQVGDSQFPPSLAINNTNNYPYVAYTTYSGRKCIVMKFNGSSWEVIGTENIPSGEAWYTTFDLDNNNTPYIGYCDVAASNKATVKMFDGISWVNVGNPQVTSRNAYYLKLCFDKSNTPFLSYCDTSYNKAVVLKYNGTTWEKIGNTNVSEVRVESIDLTLDSNNSPYCVYKPSSGKTIAKAFTSLDLTAPSIPGTLNNIDWTPTSDPDNFDFTEATDNINGSGIDTNGYEIYWGKDDIGITPTVKIGTSDYDPPELSVYGTYYLRARAKDVSGNYSAWATICNYRYFNGQIIPAQNLPYLKIDKGNYGESEVHIDNNGNPYITYYYRNTIFLKKYFNGNWESIGPSININSPYSLTYLNSGLSNTNIPYIAFSYNDGITNNINIFKFNGTSWENLGTPNLTHLYSNYMSFALSKTGVPYISYIDYINTQTSLRVVKYNGSSWEFVGESILTGNISAYYHILKIDPLNGSPYLAYIDNNSLIIKGFNNTSWETIGGGPAAAGTTAFAFDISQSGSLYLAHNNYYNNKHCVVLRYNGSDWEKIGSENNLSSDNIYSNVNIKIGTNDTPFVSYQLGSDSSIVSMLKYDSSLNIWLPVNNKIQTGSWSYTQFKFTLDKNDNPYIINYLTDNYYSYVNVKAVTLNDVEGPNTIPTLNNTDWTTQNNPANYDFADVTDNMSGTDPNGYEIYWGKDILGTSPLSKTGTSDYDPPEFSEYGIYYLRARAKDVSGNYGSWQTLASYSYYPGTENIYSIECAIGSYCYDPSVAVDHEGTTYLAYSSASNYSLNVMKYTDTGWNYIGNNFAIESSGDGACKNLKVDNYGTPYFAYYDAGNNSYPSVKKYVNNIWETVGTINESMTTVLSLTFDNNNLPYVTYIRRNSPGGVAVKKFVSPNWISIDSAAFVSYNNFYGSNSSLCCDDLNNIYLLLNNGTTNKYFIAKYNGSFWEIIDNIPQSVTGYSNMTVAKDGTIYLVYAVNSIIGYNYDVKVSKYNGISWNDVGDTIFYQRSDTQFLISVDDNHQVFLEYVEPSENDPQRRLTIMKYDSVKDTWYPYELNFSESNSYATELINGKDNVLYSPYCSSGVIYLKAFTDRDFTRPSKPLTLNNTIWTTANNPANMDFAESTDDVAISTNGYEIYWGKDACGESPIAKIGTSDFDPPELTEFGTYYLRARARDLAGNYSYWKTICSYQYFDGNLTPAQYIGGSTFSPGGISQHFSGTTDISGNIYIIYMDGLNSNKLTVIGYLNKTWVNIGTPGFNSGNAQNTFLQTDNTGNLYVAYLDYYNNANNVVVKKYNGTAWQDLGNAGSTVYSATQPLSFQISSSNMPYVAFNESGRLSVKYYDGVTWNYVGAPRLSKGSADGISLALYGDIPYISYNDQVYGYNAIVKKYDGVTWNFVGDIGFYPNRIHTTSLRIDRNEIPYIALTEASDSSNPLKTTIMKFNNSKWETLGNKFIAYSYMPNFNINNDIKYIAFSDYSSNNSISILYYNTTSNAWLPINHNFELSYPTYTDRINLFFNKNTNYPYILYKGTNGQGCLKVLSYEDFTFPGNPGTLTNTRWTQVADPPNMDFAEATDNVSINSNGYEIYWGRDPNGTEPLAKTGTSDYDPPLITLNGTYYLKARAIDVSGNYGAWGQICYYQYSDQPTLNGQNVGAEGFSSGTASELCLDIDITGNAVVAFRDGSYSYKATAMKLISGNWTTLGTAGFTTYDAQYLSMAVNPSGNPLILFRDQANSYKATVMQYNGSSWSILGTPGFSSGNIYSSAIAFYNSIPYAAYTYNNKLYVQKYNGIGWELVGNGGFANAANGYPIKMSIDISGNIKIAHMYNNKISLMSFDGVTWNYVGANQFSKTVYSTTFGFTLDNSGNPYVAYTDTTVGNRIVVMKYNGTSWETVGIGSATAKVTNYFALTCAKDILYLAYSDIDNSSKIAVNKYDPTSNAWIPYGYGFSTGTATYIDIKPHLIDGVYIAYNDNGGSSRAYVKIITSLDMTIPGKPGTLPNTSWTTTADPTMMDFSESTDNIAVSTNGYEIYWGCDPNGTAPLAKVGTSDFTPPTLTEYGTYFLRARARDMYGNYGAWTTICYYQFYDGNLLPGQFVGTQVFSVGAVTNIGIELNKNNIPYIAFTDGSNSNKATVMRYSDAIWSTVGNAGFSTGNANNIVLTFDTNGTPYTTYQDSGTSSKALVMKFNGNTWECVGSAPSTSNATYPVLALDSNNIQYIAYVENNRITVKKYNGSAWELVGTAGFSNIVASYSSPTICLRIDPNNIPYIAYIDSNNSVKATVMRFNGTTWENVGSAGFSRNPISRISLAIDADGTPYVGLGHSTDENTTSITLVSVMKYNGTSWEIVGDPGFSGSSVSSLSLKIDMDKKLYVAFNNSLLKYNSSFNKWLPIDYTISSGAISYTDLAIASDGTPYVGYRDGSVSSKASVKAFTTADISGPAAPAPLPNTSWTPLNNPPNYDLAEVTDNINGSGVDTNGYEFYWGVDPDGTTPSAKTGTSDFDPPALSSEGMYYLRARSKDLGGNYSAWKTICYYQYCDHIVSGVYVGERGVSGNPASSSKLALDQNNIPYIVYSDKNNSEKLTAKKYVSGNWEVLGTEGFSSGKGIISSFKVYNNVPFVLFTDYANSNKATVMKYESDTWQTVGSAGFTTSSATVLSELAFDSLGAPYIAMQDGAYSSRASVLKFNGSKWVNIGNPAISTSTIQAISLAIDPSDTPYIAFSDYYKSNALTVKKYNGSSWVDVGNAGFTGTNISFLSLALDSSGAPYVLYSDTNYGSGLSVKYYNGSNWVYYGYPGFTGAAGRFPVLNFDSSNKPYAVYGVSYSGAYKIMASHYDQAKNTWLPINNGFSETTWTYPDLKLDTNNNPYISFIDNANSYKVSVMTTCNLDLTPPNFVDTLNNTTWTTQNNPANYDFPDATEASNESGLDQNSYEIYWGKDPLGTSPLAKTGTSDYDPPSLGSSYGTYFLRARIKDNAGNYTNWKTLCYYQYYSGKMAVNQLVGNAGFTPGTSQYTSLGVDTSGNCFVAFIDGANSSKASVMKYNGTDWQSIGAGISAGSASNMSIAIDKTNHIYTVFSDNGNSSKATVMKYNGTEWSYVGSQGFSAGGAMFFLNSLAIDSTNNPYIAYLDTANSNKATVMKYNGTSWTTVGSAGFTSETPYYITIALDKIDTPYIAFVDPTTYKLYVMRFNGVSWDYINPPAALLQSQITIPMKITVDTNNNILLNYVGMTGSSYTTGVIKYDGANWTKLGNTEFSAANPFYTSITIDNTNSTYLVYNDADNSSKPTLIKYSTQYNSWLPVSIGFSSGLINLPSLTMDTSQNIYVAYTDPVYSNKATVMKFTEELSTNLAPVITLSNSETNNIPLTSNIIFNITDDEGVLPENIQVLINGIDLTTSLNISGASNNLSVEYTPSPSWLFNSTYNIEISASDSNSTPKTTAANFIFTTQPLSIPTASAIAFVDENNQPITDNALLTPLNNSLNIRIEENTPTPQSGIIIPYNTILEIIEQTGTINFEDIEFGNDPSGNSTVKIDPASSINEFISTSNPVRLEFSFTGSNRLIKVEPDGETGFKTITNYDGTEKENLAPQYAGRICDYQIINNKVVFKVNRFSTYGTVAVTTVSLNYPAEISSSVTPVTVYCTIFDENNEPVSSAPLTIAIVTGNADISTPNLTDVSGNSTFTISNLTGSSIQFVVSCDSIFSATASIIIPPDTTPPTSGEIIINSGNAYTNTTNIDLSLSAYEAFEMLVFDPANTGAWEPFAPTKNWTLSVAEGTKSVSVLFRDTVGNISVTYSSSIILDSTAPSFIISGNPIAWQNSDAVIHIFGSDTISGISGSDSINITVTLNGVYEFSMSDNAGNITPVTVTVSMIDKEAPVVSVTGNPTAWTNNDAVIRITGSDVISGISGSDNIDLTITHNGIYEFSMIDNAGNITPITVTVSMIDKEGPVISVTGNPTSWTNNDAVIRITGSDAISEISGSDSINITVTRNGIYEFNMADNAGNITPVTVTVSMIDKEGPVIYVTGNPTSWTNSDAVLHITGSDAISGISGSDSINITVTRNSIYDFNMADNAGNITTVTVTVSMIDKEGPIVVVTGNPTAWTNSDAVIQISGTDNLSGMLTPMINFTATCNGVYEFSMSDNAGNITPVTVTVSMIDKEGPVVSVTGNPTTWTNSDAVVRITGTDSISGISGIDSIDFTATHNGIYEFSMSDKAGNVTPVSVTVSMIDKETPVVSVTGNPTTWTNSDAIINISWSDSLSGISGSDSVNITVTINGVYELTMADNAGNITPITVTVSMVDKDGPIVVVSGNPTAWTNSDAVIQISGTDNLSGMLTPMINFTATCNGVYEFSMSDNAGNITPIAVTVSMIDKESPVAQVITINNGADTVYDTNVLLDISCAGADFMRIGNSSDLSSAAWETYSAQRSWALTSGNGLKSVFIQFRDSAGNLSSVISDTITLKIPTTGNAQVDLTLLLHGYYDKATGAQRAATINIELRSTREGTGASSGASSNLVLDSNGHVTGIIPNVFPGTYYVAIAQVIPGYTQGVNHMTIVSSVNILFDGDGYVTTMNFSNKTSDAFIPVYVYPTSEKGGSMITLVSPNLLGLSGGDADGNNMINILDILKWDEKIGRPEADHRGAAEFSEAPNFDGNENINAQDFNVWDEANGKVAK